ncbi:MAG TPA: molybdenum cofactor guanylyltransferase [Chthoniobacterales bacterium]|nr:molybdenum cofactor guanylyltransferase [Chthoniobacterales bacterium]
MRISAVLLAGGESSRMGRDKATLSFRGELLWERQIDLLRKVQPAKLFVSAQIDPAWRPGDVEFVPDQEPSCGPLGGIVAALSRIDTEHLLVLAIDVPFMSEAYLRGLCQRCESGQGIVPIIESRAEPLVAIYSGNYAGMFAEALAAYDFALQPVIRKLITLGKLRPIEVLPEEIPLFRNLNEPQDLLRPLAADL